MIIQKHSYISKYLFIFSILFLLSGCDIVDEVFRRGVNSTGGDQAEIDRVEVDVFLDNVQYSTSDGNVNNGEFIGDFTSIAGTSSFSDSIYSTIFDNPPVLGQTIRGDMSITFLDDPRSVNVHVYQTRVWDNITGSHGQLFEIDGNGIPFNKSYTDDFTELGVDEYYESGSSVNRIIVDFVETQRIDNVIKRTDLTSYSCGARSFIKVKVHYK